MRVFVTGASGWVGSGVIPELLSHGHTILALARSDSSEEALKSLGTGVEVIRGSLTDLDALTKGASSCDAVIHCAFIHNFADYTSSVRVDLAAIKTLSAATKGPIVITSGTVIFSQAGRLITEKDTNPSGLAASRAASEEVVRKLSSGKGSVIRLPLSVHGKGDAHAFVPRLISIAREKGVSAYIGEGKNRWSTVHCLDAAVVYRLALEKGAGGVQYHAVAEEGVSTRDIAEAIGKGLGVPVVSKTTEEAAEHFGFLAEFFGIDNPTSGEWTKSELGWEPKMNTLIEDIIENYI